MIDARLRSIAGRALEPVAEPLQRVRPAIITVLGATFGLGAAITVAFGLHWMALACWLVSRILDGLDGAVARRAGTTSDFGGYLDMTLDTVVYSAIPIGIAYHESDSVVWALTAVLLATFYVNIISWSYLAALLEKRGRGAAATGESTSITMPGGLIEGSETIAFYAVFLIVVQFAAWGFAIMALAVTFTIGQRIVWAKRHLE